jgi:DNA-binding transcriptional MerR regulator
MKELPQLTKRYYTIKEVAEIFEVNVSKIRYWSDSFPSLNPTRSTSGERKYTPDDVQQLKYVYELVEEELYTLEGAKKVIERRKHKMTENQSVVNKLSQIKSFLQELRDGLDPSKDVTVS